MNSNTTLKITLLFQSAFDILRCYQPHHGASFVRFVKTTAKQENTDSTSDLNTVQ